MSYQKSIEYAFFGIVSFFCVFAINFMQGIAGDINQIKVEIAVIKTSMNK